MKKFLVLWGLVLCWCLEAGAWGFYTHRLINRHAVFLLPPEMMVFYKPHIEYLAEHAVDPDKRRYAVANEGGRHYFDMDHYDKRIFSSFDITWKKAGEMFHEDTLQLYGTVPWWIQVMLQRLTDAFSKGDGKKILKVSAELGHYIGDAHVPLHATGNHNGQLTAQHGIHGFWESRLPELLAEKEWDFWIGNAEYISKPLPFTWKRVFESSAAADTVLLFERLLNDKFPSEAKYAFEERNGLLLKQYSAAYTNEYNKMLNGMVERRFRQSVFAVASFWYTAWINAGQPDCRKILGNVMFDEQNTEYEELNRKWREGRISGKSCD